jgi:hypothetical protein
MVQEASIDTGCHVMAGSEQIGKLQERIHPGDDFDAKGAELRPYRLPEDGSPVTITTRCKKTKGDLSTRKSQTPLLIEYFEGGKGMTVNLGSHRLELKSLHPQRIESARRSTTSRSLNGRARGSPRTQNESSSLLEEVTKYPRETVMIRIQRGHIY